VEAARIAREQSRAAAWQARRRETERKAAERLARQQHLVDRQQHVDALNAELQQRMAELDSILTSALTGRGSALDFEGLKQALAHPPFDPQGADQPAPRPRLEDLLPKPLSWLQQRLPGSTKRHDEATRAAKLLYDRKLAEYAEYDQQRTAWLADARRRYAADCEQRRKQVEQQHAEVERLRAAYLAGDREALIEVVLQVFEGDDLPDGFPRNVDVTFDPDEHLLVIERELPAVEVIPTLASYRWYKTRDEIEEVRRQANQIKTVYTTLIANMALRTLHIAFSSDTTNVINTIVLNCYVDVINPATGLRDKPFLLTVRVKKETFTALDLRLVQPVLCLKRLHALMSRSPHELEPVEPILKFNMVDARFVEGQPILDQLDQRPNIATLNPYEFESLIRDLFEKMGHDTKQTRPSRDGGVDCVAFDTRPIVGGRVVIQAKRYKHVVGVSAVRDLYGTMHNERANKGILITTSHFTSAAHQFAKGLPLQLIDGAGLLSLLETEAGVQAKIDFPEGWADPTRSVSED
jgi:restriction system protein